MKHFIITVAIALGYSVSSYAQLKVEHGGNVGIQCSSTALSPLSVGQGRTGYAASILGPNCGLICTAQGAVILQNWSYAIKGICDNQSNLHYKVGLSGEVKATAQGYSGRTYGVMGLSGNASSGYNYGVFGRLNGEYISHGAAVYDPYKKWLEQ